MGDEMSYQLNVCHRDIITPEGRIVNLVHKHPRISTAYNLKFIPNYPWKLRRPGGTNGFKESK